METLAYLLEVCSWLSSVSSHCERLLLQKRQFKELMAISTSCPSQLLDLTEDISAAHLGWGEAEGRKRVTSLRQQMLHEKMMIYVPQQKKPGWSSANSTCPKVRRAIPAGKCGVCLMWQWGDPGYRVAAGSCPKASTQQLVAGLAVGDGGGSRHLRWWGVSVVNVLLLTLEGNTDFDFHDLYGGIVNSSAL